MEKNKDIDDKKYFDNISKLIDQISILRKCLYFISKSRADFSPQNYMLSPN